MGAGQEYETNPQARLMDYARNAALMGAFAAIGGAHGITADEAAAGTILDWAKGKGYSDEPLARAIKLQGISPLANEMAEEEWLRTPATSPSSLDQLASKFKLVARRISLQRGTRARKGLFLRYTPLRT